VNTDADQFSVRHRPESWRKRTIRSAGSNYDNLTGPTTNPDQTLLDPSFGVQYVDRQRNGSSPTRTLCRLGFSGRHRLSFHGGRPHRVCDRPYRSRHLKFIDGLYEAYNSAAGSVMSAFGNLFQGQVNFYLDDGAARR